MKAFTTIVVVVFTLAAVLHLLRILRGWEVTIGGVVIPIWVSYVGLLLASGLAFILRRESLHGRSKEKQQVVAPLFLCDEVSIGQFGKVNLMGLNPGDELTIPQVPYRLFSTLVAQNIILPSGATSDLVFTVQQKDTNDLVIFEEKHPVATLNREDSIQDLNLFFVQPLKWEIRSYGTVIFTVLSGDQVLGVKTIQVGKGNAPSSALIDPITSTGVINETKGFILDSILKSASRTLILMDQFLKPDDLVDLMGLVPSGCIVKLLTSPNWRNDYLQNRSTIDHLPQEIEIKFSGKFHDRYVIVNDTEHFHFGYSLKDLWRRRVSRYAKLYRKDEIDDLMSVYEVDWRTAQTL
jgi:hypothetical protein